MGRFALNMWESRVNVRNFAVRSAVRYLPRSTNVVPSYRYSRVAGPEWPM